MELEKVRYDKDKISPVFIKYLLRFIMEIELYDLWIPLTKTSDPCPVEPDDKDYLNDLPLVLVTTTRQEYEHQDKIIYRIVREKMSGSFLKLWRIFMNKHRKESTLLTKLVDLHYEQFYNGTFA